MLPRACLLALLTGCGSLFGLDSVTVPPDAATITVADAAPQLAMIEDNFEGAIDPRWRRILENGDECALTTEHAASGTHSVRCRTDSVSGTRAALVLDFEPTPTLRVQMDVRFASPPQAFIAFVQLAHVSETQASRLVNADYYTEGRIDVWNYNTMTYDFHPATISLDTWYRIDFRAQISSPDGRVALTLDGETGMAELAPTDTTNLPINQLQLGITLVNTANETLTMYIDDVVVTP